MMHFIVWYLSIGVAGAMCMWMTSDTSNWVANEHRQLLSEVQQSSMWERSDDEFKRFFPGFLLITFKVLATIVVVLGWLWFLAAALIDEVRG
jgi:hypothetical protein